MRAFLLDHAAAGPLPSHRAEGLGASLTIHLSIFASLAGAPMQPPSGPASTVAVTYLTDSTVLSESRQTIERPPEIAEAPAEGPAADGSTGDLALDLPGFDFDVTKVGNASDLFPFLTDPLVFLDEAREKFRQRPDRLVNPFGPERQPTGAPPFTADDAEVQRIVDRAWSRRDRWSNFAEIAEILTTHDPQNGRAHALMRRYLDENLLQPYYDGTTRDPRFWVMLGLAADHARLIEFIGSFVRDHPSSRTTTELLFMLDEFAQASRDTLLMLLSTDPRSDLDDTRNASLPAFQIAESVHDRYETLSRDRGLIDTKTVRNYFDSLRLRILRTIVETTPDGYGVTDARFLAGRLLWDQNKAADALEWWSGLTSDSRDAYRLSSESIRRELAFRDGQTSSEVSRILGGEYRRWLTLSEERLRQFGYQFDTF